MEEKVAIAFHHKKSKNFQKGVEILRDVLQNEEKPISLVYYELSTYPSHIINEEKKMEYLGKAVQMLDVMAIGVLGKKLVEARKDFKQSISHLVYASNHGDIMATIKLAELYQNGVDKELKANPQLSFHFHQKAAEMGCLRSLTDVGYCYSTGFGVQKNKQMAIHIFEKAYNEGYVPALSDLAMEYRESDAKKSVELLERALEEGHVGSVVYLTQIFSDGIPNMEKDPEKAVKYASIGASYGKKHSYYILAKSFRRGIGCQLNLETALKYAKLAADLDHKDACELVGELYYDQKQLNESLFYYEKSFALGNKSCSTRIGLIYRSMQKMERAHHYLKISHALGENIGTFLLGDIYYNGYPGFKSDLNKSIEYYAEAYNKGIKNGDIILANIYLLMKSYNKSMEYFLKVIDRGEASGYNGLGKFYYFGYGVTQDYQKALQYFNIAYERGHRKEACFFIGMCYLKGKAVEMDKSKSLTFFVEGSNYGNADCMYNAGFSYQIGDGCEIDLSKALHYFKLAEKHGHPKASTQCSVIPFLMNKWIPDEEAKKY